jgi:hypothetical protein
MTTYPAIIRHALIGGREWRRWWIMSTRSGRMDHAVCAAVRLDHAPNSELAPTQFKLATAA